MVHILEINFMRLLCSTEELLNSEDFNELRYQNFLETLDNYLTQLVKSKTRPTAESIRHYELRVS